MAHTTVQFIDSARVVENEWVGFPGGELEGKRPKALCPACRETLKREALGPSPGAPRRSGRSRPLCFQCYRAELDRERALEAAGSLDTASVARFQCQLPLEPVNTARLAVLKVVRAESRAASSVGIGPYVDKRRHAQMAARHELQAATWTQRVLNRLGPLKAMNGRETIRASLKKLGFEIK